MKAQKTEGNKQLWTIKKPLQRAPRLFGTFTVLERTCLAGSQLQTAAAGAVERNVTISITAHELW